MQKITQYKPCRRCKLSVPYPDGFPKNYQKNPLPQLAYITHKPYCRTCEGKRKDEQKRRHREEWHQLLKPACNICGTTENVHYHHVEPETKKFEMCRLFIAYSPRRTAPRNLHKVLRELVKCDPVCNKHHQKIHHELARREKQDKIPF